MHTRSWNKLMHRPKHKRMNVALYALQMNKGNMKICSLPFHSSAWHWQVFSADWLSVHWPNDVQHQHHTCTSAGVLHLPWWQKNLKYSHQSNHRHVLVTFYYMLLNMYNYTRPCKLGCRFTEMYMLHSNTIFCRHYFFRSLKRFTWTNNNISSCAELSFTV